MPARSTRPTPDQLHLLQARAQWLAERVDAGAHKHGYGDVTPAMGRLFALMVGESLSVSEAARRLAVTRQAVHKLAADAAALGYLQVQPAPGDARMRLLAFTARGRAMARVAAREVQRIEAQLTRALGERRLAALKQALAAPWDAAEPSPRPPARAPRPARASANAGRA